MGQALIEMGQALIEVFYASPYLSHFNYNYNDRF